MRRLRALLCALAILMLPSCTATPEPGPQDPKQWSTTPGTEVAATFQGGVSALEIDNNGRLFVAEFPGGDSKIYEIKPGGEKSFLQLATGVASSISAENNYLAFGGFSAYIRYGGGGYFEIQDLPREVNWVDGARDILIVGDRLVVAAVMGSEGPDSIAVYDIAHETQTPRRYKTIGVKGWVFDLERSPDPYGGWIAMVKEGPDSRLRRFDLDDELTTQQPDSTFNGQPLFHCQYGVALSWGTQISAAIDNCGNLALFDDQWQVAKVFRVSGGATNIAVADSKHLFIGFVDGHIEGYEIGDQSISKFFTLPSNGGAACWGLAWNPQERALYSSSGNKLFRTVFAAAKEGLILE